MNTRLQLVAKFFFAWFGLQTAYAIDEFKDIKTIQRLPMSNSEVEAAHASARGELCELIAAGELVETRTYAMTLTDRDRRENARRPPSTRQSIFSVGLSIDPVNQVGLPKLSRSRILEYLDDHFVILQARVRQDLLDRKPYYHHRPIAVTSQFDSSRLTVDFEPVIANSIHDFHSLGLFSPDPKRLKPENLRTIVLMFKNNRLKGNRIQAQYEYAFIQGIIEKSGKTLLHHAFVTSENRQKLNYLTGYQLPSQPNACSIKGSVVITDYDSSGIFPKSSAVESHRLNVSRSVTLAEINTFCDQHGYVGGIEINLDSVLIAVIDNRL